MANGEVTIRFGGVNLDACIEQGLEFTGFAKCPYCKQVYSFDIQISKKFQMPRYPETKAATAYDVSIDFSGDADFTRVLDYLGESGKLKVDPPCVPCNGCTPNCERLRGR